MAYKQTNADHMLKTNRICSVCLAACQIAKQNAILFTKSARLQTRIRERSVLYGARQVSEVVAHGVNRPTGGYNEEHGTERSLQVLVDFFVASRNLARQSKGAKYEQTNVRLASQPCQLRKERFPNKMKSQPCRQRSKSRCS